MKFLSWFRRPRDTEQPPQDAEPPEAPGERPDAIRRAHNIGISLQEFERAEADQTKEHGFPPKPRSVFWGLANAVIERQQ